MLIAMGVALIVHGSKDGGIEINQRKRNLRDGQRHRYIVFNRITK